MVGHSRKPLSSYEVDRRKSLLSEALAKEPGLTATAAARRTGLPYDWVRAEMRVRRVAADFDNLLKPDKPQDNLGSRPAPPQAPKEESTTVVKPLTTPSNMEIRKTPQGAVPHHPPTSLKEFSAIEEKAKHSALELNAQQQRIANYIQTHPGVNDNAVANVFGIRPALVKYVRQLANTKRRVGS